MMSVPYIFIIQGMHPFMDGHHMFYIYETFIIVIICINVQYHLLLKSNTLQQVIIKYQQPLQIREASIKIHEIKGNKIMQQLDTKY
jgi:hypothetical protein